MKFKSKFINKRNHIIETEPDIKTVTETVIEEIRKEPEIKGNGLSKKDKIEKIKNIVLKDKIDNKSIERLNKFINFSIN